MIKKKKMKTIKINPKKISELEIKDIAAQFKRGFVVAYPTDTIYGLGCIATDVKAIAKIFRMKKRSKNKPLLILAGSLTMLKKYCYINKKQSDYLKKIWLKGGKPVSVVLQSRGILPAALSGGADGIAARLPKNDFLIKIIRKAGAPIISTSLNISGREYKENVNGLEKYFGKNNPDLAIDAGVLKGKPSRLVDASDVENVKVLRK